MDVKLDAGLFRDPQDARPVGFCPLCGGELYGPDGYCARCERRRK